MCNCGKRAVPSVRTQVQKQTPRSLGIKPVGTTIGYGGVTPRTNVRRTIIRTK
jgi:hypothetical protein